MLYFENDYAEGAAPAVLQALIDSNMEHLPGYGEDRYSQAAADKIRTAMACPDATVKFITGGTQTNALALDLLLQPYEGVIAPDTAHINTHEAGAIELTGHKVLPQPSKLGKIDAATIEQFLTAWISDGSHEHMVQPGMVYLTFPTEYGTLYTADELRAIATVCRQHDLRLYIDGARLAYGLAASNDVTLPLLAQLCDAFYIGGTKCGALAGEALVFTRPDGVPAHLVNRIKQHGALVAKGRLLGVQFGVLFTDGLYEQLGKHALRMADNLRRALVANGIPRFIESPTNQQFPVVSTSQQAQLAQNVRFSVWGKYDDDHTVIRLATSWATTEDDVTALAKELQRIGA
ncbi:threonine aldolase family protein [Lacticaseibacillus thailandensis]|nr:aminotransferase class I/II-fold pyridoxal phosphate-dependent enzyme [Lacticaseibacillus thailandensis]